ncbi:MAG: RNA polymerase sigma factor [Ilumatobacteraceae bacterium]
MAVAPPHGQNDLSPLVRAAQSGDRGALSALITQIEPDIRRLVLLLGDADATDDLVQDAMERIISGLDRFRGDGPFLNWVRQITRWTCADSARRRARIRHRDAQLARDTVTAETPVAESSGATELGELIEGLDGDRRDAFIATQILGLSYAEAAAVLDCPIGTVRSRVARARVDLISQLDPCDSVETLQRRSS